MKTIYLDHAATTPVYPEVVEKMSRLMMETYGNPSSIHAFGRQARQVLDDARLKVADTIHGKFSEVIFTSGGTEADNLAIIGTATANRDKGKHVITTAIEHHAVLHACEYLEKEGFDVTYLQPDSQGIIQAEAVKKALRDDTILVTIMFANNEVGTIQPVKEIGSLLSGHQAYFHTDAVQAYGTELIDVDDLQVDLLSVSSHKINGPKGVGCLYIRTGTLVDPRFFGGEQELKRRPGTENLISIAGFAEAAEITSRSLDEKRKRYKGFKDQFLKTLELEQIDFVVNGSMDHSIPHVLNVSFPEADVEALLVNLDLAGIAASSGSACTAGSLEPSHVLTAMFGKESDRSTNSIRFSFGYGNSTDQIEEAAVKTAEVVRRFQT